MLFQSIVLASTAAIGASALPTAGKASSPFGLVTIRSGSDVQNAGVQAAKGSVFVNLKSQNATCAKKTNFATFSIKNEVLSLYTGDATAQTFFVDRSGMGQGNIGYITGNENLGKNFETVGWNLNKTTGLNFKGDGLQACPNSIDGGWSLWLTGVAEPGFNKGCLGVNTLVVDSKDPIACEYTK